MARRSQTAAVALLTLLVWAQAAHGFDGQRKGMVLGIGLGVTPSSIIAGEPGSSPYQETGSGISIPVQIGWAWSDRDMLTGLATPLVHHSTLFDDHVVEGVVAAAWTHYWGPQGRAPFTTLGLGEYVYEQLPGYIGDLSNLFRPEPARPDTPDRNGPGFLVGGGYEFANHVQAGCYVSGGRVSGWNSAALSGRSGRIDYTVERVDVALTWVAY